MMIVLKVVRREQLLKDIAPSSPRRTILPHLRPVEQYCGGRVGTLEGGSRELWQFLLGLIAAVLKQEKQLNINERCVHTVGCQGGCFEGWNRKINTVFIQ